MNPTSAYVNFSAYPNLNEGQRIEYREQQIGLVRAARDADPDVMLRLQIRDVPHCNPPLMPWVAEQDEDLNDLAYDLRAEFCEGRPKASCAWYCGMWVVLPNGKLVMADPDNPEHFEKFLAWATVRGGSGRFDPIGMDSSAEKTIPAWFTNATTHPTEPGYNVASSEVGKSMLDRFTRWADRLRPYNIPLLANANIRTSNGDLDPAYAHVEQFGESTEYARWMQQRPNQPIQCPPKFCSWMMLYHEDFLPPANDRHAEPLANKLGKLGYLLCCQSEQDAMPTIKASTGNWP